MLRYNIGAHYIILGHDPWVAPPLSRFVKLLLQKDCFHKKGFRKQAFFRKKFWIFLEVMTIPSKGFFLKKHNGISSKGFENYNGNFFHRFWKGLQCIFLSKIFYKNTMEISFQGFEKAFWKKMHRHSPIGCANLFTGVFGKQYQLVLVMTSIT